MAGSYPQHTDDIGSLVARLEQRIEHLATTPSAGNQSIQEGALAILNSSNFAEVQIGEYEWPTSPWAGNKIYGLIAFGATQHPLLVAGLQPDGAYGLGLYDDSGARAVFLGDQGSGLYGLGIRNHASGLIQQVGGAVTVAGADVLGYSTSSLTATTATVTVTLGPSGQAIVTPSLQINASSAPTSYGSCQLKIGSTSYGAPLIQNAGAIGTVSSTYLVAPGSGSKTFTLYVGPRSGTDPIDYQAINLVVQPL